MISSLCDDIYKLFLLGIKADKRELFNKVSDLTAYSIKNPITANTIETVIALERKMMNSKGAHKNYIEQQLFQIFSRSAMYYCSPKKSGKKYLLLNDELVRKEKFTKEKEKYIISLKLVNFADEIFEFNIARDNFSNKRKALSLEYLSILSNYYDLPKSLELCLFSLKSKKKDLIFAALEFQENYARNRHVHLSEEIIELLNKIILQTKDRSVATGALNLQVITGEIGEFEALSRIDRWKEKNDNW
jgi:hypothetical protein